MVDANVPSIQNSKFPNIILSLHAIQHFFFKKNLGFARSPHLSRNRPILLPRLFSSFYLLPSCLDLSHPSRTSPRAIAMSIGLTMAPFLPPRIHNSPHISHRPRPIPPFSRRREPTYDRRRFHREPFSLSLSFQSMPLTIRFLPPRAFP